MNQRITNQLHQLSAIGSIIETTLTADTPILISSGISIDSTSTHFQVMTTEDAKYRSDNVSGGVFPISADSPIILTIRDFKKTYILPSAASTLYIQALGE